MLFSLASSEFRIRTLCEGDPIIDTNVRILVTILSWCYVTHDRSGLTLKTENFSDRSWLLLFRYITNVTSTHCRPTLIQRNCPQLSSLHGTRAGTYIPTCDITLPCTVWCNKLRRGYPPYPQALLTFDIEIVLAAILPAESMYHEYLLTCDTHNKQTPSWLSGHCHGLVLSDDDEYSEPWCCSMSPQVGLTHASSNTICHNVWHDTAFCIVWLRMRHINHIKEVPPLSTAHPDTFPDAL